MKTLVLILFISSVVYSQILFDEFYINKTLRIDYYHTGDKINDTYSIDELLEEPYWGGSKSNLIEPFNYGNIK